jgi:4-hydroxy-tetrahydrodipicolinate synthase
VTKRFDLTNDRSSVHGIFPPILTPMNEDESVDVASTKKLVQFVVANGVHGIWAMGTTGEFASFDERERALAVEAAVEGADGKVPVIANVADCSTRLAIRHGQMAKAAGADALAATPPYYFSNSQGELLNHYRRLREAVDLPLFLYNIPQTVKTKTEVATALKLAEEGVIVGLKDSQNDLDWFRQVTTGARVRGIDLRCFLGTRFLIDAGQLVGACGSIPSFANIVPAACAQTYEAAAKGDWAKAATHQERVMAVEKVAGLLRGGCNNAAVMGSMKTLLRSWGVIACDALGSPLKRADAAETAALIEMAAKLELGKGY